jgi:S-formylglutathione hydrolase FrmB
MQAKFLMKILSRISLLLVFFFLSLANAASETIAIPSAVMKKSFKACVVTPRDYAAGNRYSVIYLLHGYSGNFTTWLKIAPLEAYADSFHIIIVCPDGNYNSWYLDSPVKTNSAFASYIIKEVIPFIDGNYHTWAEAKGRAIIGSSMGGHGALTLLAMHPDIFCGAGSISGIMDLTEFPGEWDIALVLGPFDRNQRAWQEHSFIGMAENLVGKNRAIILDCGASDFALPGNRKAHELLQKLQIPHEYLERPGSHTLSFSAGEIGTHLHYLTTFLLPPGK